MPDDIKTGIGASVKRKEDLRFITGKGNYTDDINRPGQLHAYMLRSNVASGSFKLDISDAKVSEGVISIFVGNDMEVGSLPCGWQVDSTDGTAMREPPHPPIAKDQVKYFKKNIKLKDIKKNDIIYWKGHVAVALSGKKLIHAYGPMKKTVIMNINQTIKRIEKTAKLKVIGIKRP